MFKQKHIEIKEKISQSNFIELKKIFKSQLLIIEEYSKIFNNNIKYLPSLRKELLLNRFEKSQALLDKWKTIELEINNTPNEGQMEFFKIATENIILSEISIKKHLKELI